MKDGFKNIKDSSDIIITANKAIATLIKYECDEAMDHEWSIWDLKQRIDKIFEIEYYNRNPKKRSKDYVELEKRLQWKGP